MPQIQSDRALVLDCFLEAVADYPRKCNGPYDFGDAATVGKHLKRSGKTLERLDIEKDFGVFFGEIPGRGWVAAIKQKFMNGFTGVEIYKTLDELKQVWMLD